MNDKVSGQVAKITSDRELIINRGASHNVSVGMIFRVNGDKIVVIDPESGEDIGNVAPVKVFVRVEEVGQKFAIARTFREKRLKVQDAVEAGPGYYSLKLGGLGGMFQPPAPAKWETRIETLRSDPTKGEPLHAEDSLVAVGDTVESVPADENIDQITTTLYR